MITKSMIEERIIVLNTDIQNVNKKLRDLEQQRIENVGLLNALTGACLLYTSPSPRD